jgi:hypothetical protein
MRSETTTIAARRLEQDQGADQEPEEGEADAARLQDVVEDVGDRQLPDLFAGRAA